MYVWATLYTYLHIYANVYTFKCKCVRVHVKGLEGRSSVRRGYMANTYMCVCVLLVHGTCVRVCARVCMCMCVWERECCTDQGLLELTFEVFNWCFSLYAGATWLINMWDVTHSYLRHDLADMTYWSISLVFPPVCGFDMTDLHVRRDSFMFLTWHSAFTCVKWLHLYACVTWLYLYACVTWLHLYACVTWLHLYVWCDSCSYVWHDCIQMCGFDRCSPWGCCMTHTHVWHDPFVCTIYSFIRVTWPIHMYNVVIYVCW